MWVGYELMRDPFTCKFFTSGLFLLDHGTYGIPAIPIVTRMLDLR